MKRLLVLASLLLFAVPVKSDVKVFLFNADETKGYNYGYVHGVGDALCALANSNLITKEYAKGILDAQAKLVIEYPMGRTDADRYYAEQAYKDIKESDQCKEIY